MIVQSRQEAIDEFLESCKAIQKFSEYIFLELSYSNGPIHNFQCQKIEEVKNLIQDYPNCYFKVYNSINLDDNFVDDFTPDGLINDNKV